MWATKAQFIGSRQVGRRNRPLQGAPDPITTLVNKLPSWLCLLASCAVALRGWFPFHHRHIHDSQNRTGASVGRPLQSAPRLARQRRATQCRFLQEGEPFHWTRGLKTTVSCCHQSGDRRNGATARYSWTMASQRMHTPRSAHRQLPSGSQFSLFNFVSIALYRRSADGAVGKQNKYLSRSAGLLVYPAKPRPRGLQSMTSKIGPKECRLSAATPLCGKANIIILARSCQGWTSDGTIFGTAKGAKHGPQREKEHADERGRWGRQKQPGAAPNPSHCPDGWAPSFSGGWYQLWGAINARGHSRGCSRSLVDGNWPGRFRCWHGLLSPCMRQV